MICNVNLQEKKSLNIDSLKAHRIGFPANLLDEVRTMDKINQNMKLQRSN